MPGVEILGSSSEGTPEKAPTVLDIIRTLEKGDVVALQYDDLVKIIVVESNRGDTNTSLEGVIGYDNGYMGQYSKFSDTKWFYHERIKHIQLLAKKDTFGADALAIYCDKNYHYQKRLDRIEKRKIEKIKEIEELFK